MQDLLYETAPRDPAVFATGALAAPRHPQRGRRAHHERHPLLGDAAAPDIADRAVRNNNIRGDSEREDLRSKLEAPEQLAIDIRGNQVILASSKAAPRTKITSVVPSVMAFGSASMAMMKE